MRENKQEWFKCRSQEVPLWHRQNLSVDEMAVYTGIGRETIRALKRLLGYGYISRKKRKISVAFARNA